MNGSLADVGAWSDTQTVEADNPAWGPGELESPRHARPEVREHLEHGASRPSRTPPDQRKPSLRPRKEPPGPVEPPATGPTAGLSACSDTEKPLPEALVAPFRQTPQQRERSRLKHQSPYNSTL